MAHITQDKKKKIAALLKTIVPKNWKYTLSISNHSLICFSLLKAPKDGFEKYIGKETQVNTFYLENYFSGDLLLLFKDIKDMLNLDNFDHSDTMTDYHFVGHYIDVNLGKFGKPLQAC
jgi:hypothetical protein